MGSRLSQGKSRTPNCATFRRYSRPRYAEKVQGESDDPPEVPLRRPVKIMKTFHGAIAMALVLGLAACSEESSEVKDTG
jgi:hypothetical protein